MLVSAFVYIGQHTAKSFLIFCLKTQFFVKHNHLCILDVFKAWDYARTISRSKKLHIACLRTDIGTKKYIFRIFEHFGCNAMCVFYVCIQYIQPMYVFRACMQSMNGRTEPFQNYFFFGAISELLFFINQMNGILRKFCSFGPWPDGCGMHTIL